MDILFKVQWDTEVWQNVKKRDSFTFVTESA